MPIFLTLIDRPCPICGGTLNYIPEGEADKGVFFMDRSPDVPIPIEKFPFVSCNSCELIGSLDGRVFGLSDSA